MVLLSEGLLVVVGVSAGLLAGVTVNLLGRAIPLAMETEWRRHAVGLRDLQAGVRPAMLKAAAGAFYVECQLCMHSAPLGNFSPLLELILRGGCCRSCGMRIVHSRLALPELVCVAASVAMLYRYGPSLAAAGGIFYLGALVLLALTSVQRQLMPDMVTYPLLWAGLGFALGATFVPLDQAVLGAAAGYLLPWSIRWLVKLASGREILGYGSFKAMAAIGAWVGPQLAVAACLIAMLLKAADWFPYRTEGAVVGRFCPLGAELAAAGVIVFAML